MRYLIDDRGVEPEIALALYRTTLVWAASRAGRFQFSLRPSMYKSPEEVQRFYGLGTVVTPISPKVPRTLFGWILARLLPQREESVQVTGQSGLAFVKALTWAEAPPKAIAGDICPVEDLILYVGDRPLYAVYDYGRDQVLDLTEGELESLRNELQRANLDPNRVRPAPPYITKKK